MTPGGNHSDLPPPCWLLSQEVEERMPSGQKDQWRADEGRHNDELQSHLQILIPRSSPLLLELY